MIFFVAAVEVEVLVGCQQLMDLGEVGWMQKMRWLVEFCRRHG